VSPRARNLAVGQRSRRRRPRRALVSLGGDESVYLDEVLFGEAPDARADGVKRQDVAILDEAERGLHDGLNMDNHWFAHDQASQRPVVSEFSCAGLGKVAWLPCDTHLYAPEPTLFEYTHAFELPSLTICSALVPNEPI
jgi:hypothetical protein